HIELSQGGTQVAEGFIPVSFTLNNNIQYTLGLSSFQPFVFDHWKDNGSTDDPRSISINSDTQLVAVYKHTALALNPSLGPVSTVVTTKLSGFPANAVLHLLYDGTSVPTTPATMTTDSNGSFTATFTVPSSTTGARTGTGEEGPDPTDKSATAQFTVGQGILLNPTSTTNGGEVKVTGAGFSPNTGISMNFDTDVVSPLGDPGSNPIIITTDSAGGFVADIQVPWSTAGSHTISATNRTHTSTMSIIVTPASLLFDPSTGHAGTTVNFHASGFAANSAITITFDSTAVVTTPSPLTTSVRGEAPGSFTIPTSAAVGAHP